MKNVIDKQIEIAAPVEFVWKYLTEQDLLAAWLMRNNFELKLGHNFQFYGPATNDWDGELHCEVVEIQPPHRLSFTWNANDIGTETLVTIELAASGKQTRLRLIHTNFNGAAFDIDAIVRRHNAGWDDHLEILGHQAREARWDRAYPEIDWTAFSLFVTIEAAPEQVLRRWTTDEGMESFFVEMMQIRSPDSGLRDRNKPAGSGDRFIWRWHNRRSQSGEYRHVSKNRVVFSFGESDVEIRVQPVPRGTMLRLRQFNIPETEISRMHTHANCRAAWVYFLSTLKAQFEHGIDIRDHSREMGGAFSTFFDPKQAGWTQAA